MIALLVRTLMEEKRLQACLEYHLPYVDYVHVFDGGSTDRTVEIAEQYADKVTVDKDKHWGRFTNKAVYLIPPEHRWVLMVDTDEFMDIDFLHRMRRIISENNTISFRLPRINLPNARDYPDYLVRLFRRDKGIVWMNKIHEVPTIDGELISKLGAEGCLTLHKYPITHLPRRNDIMRPWWNPDGSFKSVEELMQTYEFEV